MHIAPDWHKKTDEELASLTLEHQDVFAVLIQRYEARLLRYIRSISSASTEDAEDILQEAFIKAYQHLNDFDIEQKFSSWIYRIVRNETISSFRKKRIRPEGHGESIDDALSDRLASHLHTSAQAEEKERRETIHRILEALDPKYRDVLALKYLEEKSYTEIAYILQKPMGTIATLLNRAKKQFEATARKQGVDLHML
jgi:RNA polymerase sigma-70 factor (ECF subfamily)